MTLPASLDLGSLAAWYAAGHRPRELVQALLERAREDDRNTWVALATEALLEPLLQALDARDPASLPLYGVPFAIKDNIDLAGMPTTAGCPSFARMPAASAFVVERLIAAGALPLGKCNLDQFATGLNGTRSPYGACANAFDPAFIAGGSSSGSAVAVALGQVSFALGTDTAGSGRVPAAFNNLVGLKPTRGALSTRGVVPACASLDCVSIFALTTHDAHAVWCEVVAFDPDDPFSRPLSATQLPPMERARLAVPPESQWSLDDPAAVQAWRQAIERASALGAVVVERDLSPFLEAARLLYEGPWVAERHAAVGDFIATRPEGLDPVVVGIIASGAGHDAVGTFRAQHRLRALARACEATWGEADAILLPTTQAACSIEDMRAAPVEANARLGVWTNFVNLLDLAAVAVPAGSLTGGRADGLPWGVTLVAPAGADAGLLRLADALHRALPEAPLGAGSHRLADSLALAGVPRAPRADATPRVEVVVCGAHLTGLPLNHQLTSRGAFLVEATRSTAEYRLYALAGGPPLRPGMVRVGEGGSAIEVEVWSLPLAELGGFLAGIPAPLGLGRVRLEGGREACGFICEPIGVEGAVDITAFGGWRAWLASQRA